MLYEYISLQSDFINYVDLILMLTIIIFFLLGSKYEDNK